MSERSEWRPNTVAALALGLALRILFVWKHPRFDGDTLVYGDLAHNMLQHHVYGLTENVIRPTLIRLPGYPLFLAAMFAVFGTGKYLPAIWVQVAVGLGTCWLMASLTRRLLGRRAGVVALWAGCLCPFTANFDAAALAESWSLFCVALALWALERWWQTRLRRWAAVVGMACSWAVLLRPEQGLLAAACVPVLLWFGWRSGRGGLAPAALASLVVALPLTIWGLRNWHVFHVVQPLAPKYANDPEEFVSLGFNRWYRTWAVEYTSTVNTYWMYDGGAIRISDLPARAIDSPRQRVETAHAYSQYNEVQSAMPKVDAAFAKLAAERSAAHPLRTYVLMPLGRELDMWLRPRTEFFKLPLFWWRWREHPGASLLCLLYAALDWVYLGLAGWGLWRWRGWSRHPAAVAALVFVALRCLLLLTIDNSEPRYTLECFPVLWMWIGAALRRRQALSARSSARPSEC